MYTLSITFRSNKHPFSTIYEPYPKNRFKTEDEAVSWALGIKEGLGWQYDVTLLFAGKVITLPPEDDE
jgi:hypothetical protein